MVLAVYFLSPGRVCGTTYLNISEIHLSVDIVKCYLKKLSCSVITKFPHFSKFDNSLPVVELQWKRDRNDVKI